MHAEIVRFTQREIDIKVVDDDDMRVLQWRRRLLHDEVLLDGKPQATSYGMFNREKVYGLVFGSDEEGQGGQRVMLIVDPRAAMNWGSGRPAPLGVRLETAEGPLVAYGSLDPKALEKPATFADWMKKSMGMEWGSWPR